MYVSEKCYMKYMSIPSPSTVHPPLSLLPGNLAYLAHL